MSSPAAWRLLYGDNTVPISGAEPTSIDTTGVYLAGSVSDTAFVAILDWTPGETPLNSSQVVPMIEADGAAYPWDIYLNRLPVPMIEASGSIYFVGLAVPAIQGYGVAITDIILDSSVTLPLEGTTLAAASLQTLPMESTNNVLLEIINILHSTATLPLEKAQGTIGPFAIVSLPMEHASGTMVTGSITDPFHLPVIVPMIIARGSFVYAFGSHQTLPMEAANDSAVTGEVFGSANVVPLAKATGSAFQPTILSSSNTLGMLFATGAFGESVIGPSYLTVSMHTEKQALVEYTNYPFNSFAILNGAFLAAGNGGLVVLSGDNDAGVEIDSVVRGGITDFGTQTLKRVAQMNIGYKTAGNLVLNVIADEVNQNEYILKENRQDGMHPARVVIGRGLAARYWQFEIRNIDGADFSLNQMELDPIPLQRHVGGRYA